MNVIRKNLKWIILVLCLLVFINLATGVFHDDFMQIDIWGDEMVSYLRCDFMTAIAKFITNFGGALCLVSILVSSFIFFKNKKVGGLIALNLIIITVLNLVIKEIIHRPRPTGFRLIEEFGYSFPSGHSMVSGAFYGFIIYLVYKYVQDKKLKIFLIFSLSLLILLIGVSRIYLGVHYTTDVIGGFLISLAYLVIYTSIVMKFILKKD